MIDNLNNLIIQFGGKTNLALILVFFTLFFFLNLLLVRKKIRLIFSVFSSFFISSQLTSLYFTQEFIGYSFYVHFNFMDFGTMMFLYSKHIVFFIIFNLILISVFYFTSFFLLKKNIFRRSKVYTLSIIFLSILIIFFKGDFFTDTKSLITIFRINNKNFDKTLKNFGIHDYVKEKDIKSKKGKNIIIISVESIEKNFLKERFSSITPNLQKLSKDWNIIDLKQNEGSSWTSGSLYTLLTGFPSYFGLSANNIFLNSYNSKIPSLSTILKNAGYKTIFIGGNVDFSGTKNMLMSFKFDKILDKSSIKFNPFESEYGLRDKEVFDLAKEQLSLFSDKKENYALFISTTDTHFPDGIYDIRMKKYITEMDNKLNFTISSLDYLISDFLSFLKNKNILDDTVVYIFPDHLKMGNSSIFELDEDRNLFLLSNRKIDIDYSLEHNIYQIDLPKIILKGADIQHNVKFLTDYISGDKNRFIKENIGFITDLNVNGVLKNISKNNYIDNYNLFKKDTTRFIAHGAGVIDNYTYTNSLEALDLSYKKGFRFFELDIIETSDGNYVAAHDWDFWYNISNYDQSDIPDKQTFLKYKLHGKFTPMDMDSINEWFSIHKDAFLVTDKVNDPVKFSSQFIDPSRLMMELFDMNSLKKALNLNIKSAIPSQSIIQNIPIENIADLKRMGVTEVSISRRFISNNIDLLNEYKLNGIKVYAYHINFDNGIDEEYVVRNEMSYIHGIYADDWNFN